MTRQAQIDRDHQPAAEKPKNNEERRGFEAEVSRLLKLMVHSVYSDRDIFLRELVSNACDACDKLRYEALTKPELQAGEGDFAIHISIDKKASILRISDNGIGMDHDDLINHLGTIARSGTAAFLEKVSGDQKPDLSLIGQFGVGFYSSFMVADSVRVISRKAGSADAWEWESDGEGSYVMRPASRDQHGTSIDVHLKADAKEYLEPSRLRTILQRYSDHISVPIYLDDGDPKSDQTADETPKPVNDGSALWVRPKSDITPDLYTAFYQHVAHAHDEPALVLHTKAEGVISYTALLFIPQNRPMDLFDPARKPRVKLYVKRVFISDDNDELLPGYLRFFKGVVDSEDLSLNISREMLQQNPVVRRIRKALTNKALAELQKTADKDSDRYGKIWDAFGAVLKEGLYEDADRRPALLKLARFRSTHADGLISLADYLGRMKDNQKAIYYVTGNDLAAVRRSPQLEGFRARDVEVLLLCDPVDEFWLSAVNAYEDKPFKSITRGGSDLKDLEPKDPTADAETKDKDASDRHDAAIDSLITALKSLLGTQISDVRSSDRLTQTAACLVAEDNGLDLHLERILRQHQQLDQMAMGKILEINPDHSLIKAMAAQCASKEGYDRLADSAELLLDQARILEGEGPSDPTAFAQRLARLMEQGLPSQ
ncbi:chaperone protein HtpG [Iodidimonas nitroreducens]|uniref:Chaperone protein HtpG n=1 Tax=Iodidimonas nitroreducens TaxID=1236968 RepID=A0A5A7N8S1_9PROT|nr:molecular chaperone HtpG [Iodidimonas nitroreducens]GAK34096.1 chaperone protein HtpG [alpha proteobacterium Q-1]GER03810.1 chaperone protein HtpG [Iodidimonas nitroreducens]